MMMERLTTKDFIRAPLPLCQNTPIRDESRKFDDDTMKRPVTMLSLRAQSVSAMADDSDYCKVAEHALSMLKVVYFREGADAAVRSAMHTIEAAAAVIEDELGPSATRCFLKIVGEAQGLAH